MSSRSILFNKIAMLKDEINSITARQECREQKMHIPKYDMIKSHNNVIGGLNE